MKTLNRMLIAIVLAAPSAAVAADRFSTHEECIARLSRAYALSSALRAISDSVAVSAPGPTVPRLKGEEMRPAKVSADIHLALNLFLSDMTDFCQALRP